MLAALSRLAASRRERLGVANLGRKRGGGKADPIGSPAARRKTFLQVSMEQNMGCAVGACLGCVVMSVTGTPQRVCREGPVFASDELRWEGAVVMTRSPARPGRDLDRPPRLGDHRARLGRDGARVHRLDGQPYSPLNHFVSELGEIGVSRARDGVQHRADRIGGACFVVFMVGLAATATGRCAFSTG